MHHEFEEFVLRHFDVFKPYGHNNPFLVIRRSYYAGEIGICFYCDRKEVARRLWNRQREISDKAQSLGIKWVILCVGAKAFYPPWQAKLCC